MSVVTLTINGEMVSAQSDQTVLAVLRDHNVPIPTLCHLEGLSDRGGCRLCLVEIGGSPKLQAACVTPVQEGMVVLTDTEKLRNYRRMTLEMLFAERNHVCSVCVMSGHCELQTLAAQNGMDHVRLEYMHPDLSMDASHERFVLDHNRCVLCTRCVRVCDEVEGAHTWDLMGRGVNSLVITDLNQPWGEADSCTSCGKCVQVCPTGALFAKGSTVAEMEKSSDFLQWIVGGRKEKRWNWE